MKKRVVITGLGIVSPLGLGVKANEDALFNGRTGVDLIKSFIQEQTEIQRVSKISKIYQERNKYAIKLSSAFVPLVRMGVLTGFLGTMIIGGFKSLNGEIAVGSYSVLVFLTQRFLWPFTRLAEMVDQFERAMASSRRILNLLETPNTIKIRDKTHETTGLLMLTSVKYIIF